MRIPLLIVAASLTAGSSAEDRPWLSSLPETVDIETNEGNSTCRNAAGCNLDEICNHKKCVCPPYAFRWEDSRQCLESVTIEVENLEENFEANFPDFREQVRDIVRMSAVIEINDTTNRYRFFVEAALFEQSWDFGREQLDELFGSLSPHPNVAVMTDICGRTKRCSRNSYCISNSERYQVTCLCALGYTDVSNGAGHICRKLETCLNGGYATNDGCVCPAMMTGSHCQVEVVALSVTLIALFLIAVAILHITCAIARNQLCSKNERAARRPDPDA